MDEVCKKVKELRIQSRMTLKELGEKTGFSASFLSQLENGNSSVSLNSLRKIADALQVHITYFFENHKEEEYVVRKENQTEYKVNNLDSVYIRINGKFPQRSLAPFLIKLAPRQTKRDTFQYPGEEFYYVLKGKVKFAIENEIFLLNEGDSIHFPAHLEHYGENPIDEETVLLAVVTPVIF